MSDEKDPKRAARNRAERRIRAQIGLDTAGDEVQDDFFDRHLGRARRQAPGRRRANPSAHRRMRAGRRMRTYGEQNVQEASPRTEESSGLRRNGTGAFPPSGAATQRSRRREIAPGAAGGLLRSLGGLSLHPGRTEREDRERRFRDQRSRVPRRARRSGNNSGR